MKLKSSNKRTFIFLSSLAVVAVLLLVFKKANTKTNKYPKPPEIEQTTTLDFIQVTVNEKSYRKLKKKRDKALSVGILETSDTDYVPATITFKGRDFKAEIRLKGDWTDHLKGDKWSFRVKLKDDQTIFGMRKFSIHDPRTRLFINEWLLHKAVKKEDLIGLRYHFTEGAIHIKKEHSSEYISKNVGVYALEETFDKRTLESNKRKESVILKFSEDYWWNEVKKSIEVGSLKGYTWGTFMDRQLEINKNLQITTFSEDKVLADSTLNNYFKLSKNLLEDLRQGETTLDKVFDIKELALQNAMLNLFGATHANDIINVRFYYNPITSMIEPITFDGNAGIKLNEYKHFLFANQSKDSIYLKELAHAIHRVSNPLFLEDLLAGHEQEISGYSKIIKKEFGVKGIAIPNFKHNQNVLRKELKRLVTKFNIASINLEEEINNDEAKVNRPAITSWINNGTKISATNKKRNNEEVYLLSRKNNTGAAYSIIPNNSIVYGGKYNISLIVKRGDLGYNFGFRLQTEYPSRVDAIFDLEKGQVKEMKKFGNFEKGNATIKSLGNGWYKCDIITEVNSSNVKIIFGPTSSNKKAISWEGKTETINNVNIIPSSLVLERIIE